MGSYHRDHGCRRRPVQGLYDGAGERPRSRHRAVPGDFRRQRLCARGRRPLCRGRLCRAGAGPVLAHAAERRHGLFAGGVAEGVRVLPEVRRRCRHQGHRRRRCRRLRGRPECTGKVGALGHCLGGKLAYLAAARAGVDCAVGYYGVGIEGHLNEKDKIRCPMVLHFAGEDKYLPEGSAGADQGRLRRPRRTSRSMSIPARTTPSPAPWAITSTSRRRTWRIRARSPLFRRVMGPKYDLSGAVGQALRIRVRHARRRRHHEDHGARALRQPHPDHDRRRGRSRSWRASTSIISSTATRPTPS